MPRVGLGREGTGALGEPQFRPPAARLALLSRQPVAKRRDEVVVGKLKRFSILDFGFSISCRLVPETRFLYLTLNPEP